MSQSLKDYYQILGVSKKATDDEIKKAFRSLARKYHPDANPNNKAAETRFKEVSEAYETLSDSTKRQQYDMQRDNPFAGFGGRQQQGDGGFRGGFSNASTGFGGIDDILSSFFKQNQNRSTKGNSIEVDAEISLEEAARGTMVTLNVMPPQGVSKRLSVKIPAGAQTGTKVRVSGEGEPGYNGGARGDLFVNITVKPHARFTREGDDLYIDQTISIFEAVLGTELSVPTIDGDVKVRIPAKSQSGQILRLKNKGVPNIKTQERGSLLVKLQVQTPTVVSDDDLSLWKELARRSGVTTVG